MCFEVFQYKAGKTLHRKRLLCRMFSMTREIGCKNLLAGGQLCKQGSELCSASQRAM